MNLNDALAQYLVQLEADGRSPHTIGQCRRHVGLLGRWLAQHGHADDVSAILPEHLARFVSSPEARTRPDGVEKRPASANALRSSLRTFFAYLNDAGHTPSNAARLLRRARCATPPPRGIGEEDLRRLLETLASAPGAAAERDHALFHLMAATGVRVGSVVALDVEDVDFRRGAALIRNSKGSAPYEVFLSPELCRHHTSYLGGRTTGPLFVGRRGRRLTTRHVQRRLAQWLKQADVERAASPHSLRHAFAQDLYQRTGDIALVQRALGHRSIESTLVYARCDDERLRRAVGA